MGLIQENCSTLPSPMSLSDSKVEHTHLIGFSRYLSYEIHSRFCKDMFLATLYEEINKLSMNREIEIWILLPECRDVDIR